MKLHGFIFKNKIQQLCISRNNFSKLDNAKKWIHKRINPPPLTINFDLIRLSPIETRESFDSSIPLSRNRLIRLISQNHKLIKKHENVKEFEEFCRYLDSCIANRLFFFFKELKNEYTHLNPDVDSIVPRNLLLDNEYWFIQKMSKLMELANFNELDRVELQKSLACRGGPTALQTWIDTDNYEVLKVWSLDTEEENVNSNFIIENRIFNYIFKSFSKKVKVYRRLALAVRVKPSNKIELKVFKNIPIDKLIHTMPQVQLSISNFDLTVFLSAGFMSMFGMSTVWSLNHFLPQLLTGSWANTVEGIASKLIVLSIGLAGIQTFVTQIKKNNYWEWKSNLCYKNMVASNRGVISLLSDRAQDEVLKQAILAYVHIMQFPNGILLPELESQVAQWCRENCRDGSHVVKIDLKESVTLLNQLNLISESVSTPHKLKAKSFEDSLPILVSEYQYLPLSSINSPLINTEPDADTSGQVSDTTKTADVAK